MIPIAVLASGRGSNFDAILQAVRARRIDAEIVALISDKEQAPALERARQAGIPALHVPAPAVDPGQPAEARRAAHEERILEALGGKARFLVLAGYMRVLSPKLIEAFRSDRGYTRIVNVHPSLLPSFRGVGGYQQAYEYGAHLAGVTVHLVESEVDSGPICAQESFSIAGCTDASDVERLGMAVEHRLYPETLQWVLPEKFSFERSTQRVRPN